MKHGELCTLLDRKIYSNIEYKTGYYFRLEFTNYIDRLVNSTIVEKVDCEIVIISNDLYEFRRNIILKLINSHEL